MRSSICAAVMMICVAPAMAAELRPGSRVERVIVFPSGAEVARVARLKLDRGEHEMILDDLPEQAQPGSIRVEGRASGPMTIGSVDSRRRVVPLQDPEAAASARRKLEDEIEAVKDERARYQAEAQAAEARRNFIQNLVQLPGKTQPLPGSGTPVREDWGALADLIGRETAAAQKAALEAEIKVRGADRRIRDLERRLSQERPRIENRTEVVVQVSAAAPVDAEIWVRYNVADAGWTPQYDARLVTGTKAQAAKLTLTRRASVSAAHVGAVAECRAVAVDDAAGGRHRRPGAAAVDRGFRAGPPCGGSGTEWGVHTAGAGSRAGGRRGWRGGCAPAGR